MTCKQVTFRDLISYPTIVNMFDLFVIVKKKVIFF